MANNGKGQINVLPWRNHQKNHSDTSWRKKNQMQARHLGYHIQLRKNTRMLWPLSETWMSWSPPSLNNDGDGGSTGAEAILNKLLHRQRWPLHHFPCCDPVQHRLSRRHTRNGCFLTTAVASSSFSTWSDSYISMSAPAGFGLAWWGC